MKMKEMGLDFIIDKITDCIEHRLTGDKIITDVSSVTKDDLKSVLKKNGWSFNWRKEFDEVLKHVYKLTIAGDSTIQGLICFSVEEDHVYMHLLESAPSNRGDNRIFFGVAANLVAFACKYSYEQGFEGCIAFTAKTKLIEHYEKSLGAIHIGHHRMLIEMEAAEKLIEKYFKKD
ncbi:hypothetical protein [Bacteroides sp. 519]|uniref:hypothetical protein n=1 Tax=Bacteroides sp. 519 TaxID=2302937 RepID=UPI0013D5B841|nr:hypothetical protein [Bacteroides sp. 519]NDV59171.1 hypothetical protein [Bacteroides sp. 519]